MIDMETHILPLHRELQSKGANEILLSTFETNHGFANAQNELTDAIIEWLKNDD